ncbi:MAG: YceI family protein [Gracilimonas sp.]|uniref:YceI family protein n=1 Tax=Gracilimonas sp. TaxID=1974203 RepID=UPI00199AD0A3|nr:YceI family protein [Gracilimonas sp.]MBD3617033.1 YceI family protein [Gracilimonas sp.]
MQKLLTLFLIALFISGLSNATNAQSYIGKEGQAEFISNAPLLEFKGVSGHLTGLIDMEKNLVDFYLDLNTLDTGIKLRNSHMRESYLETEDCPFAEFTGQLDSPFDPDLKEEQDITVSGDFTVHCVTKELTATGTVYPTAEGLMVNAEWEILLKDFNIDRPGVAFYELAEEQRINISILLKPEND